MKEDCLENYLREVRSSIAKLPRKELARIADTLLEARESGKLVFLIGNGGSAATASHFAHDLVKSSMKRGTTAFRAIALSDNIPIVTAIANDWGYEQIFVDQLAAFGHAGDIVIAFSVSGNSANIIKALDWAKQNALITIGFTGQTANELEKRVDLCVRVPCTIVGQVESIHLLLAQLLYEMLETF